MTPLSPRIAIAASLFSPLPALAGTETELAELRSMLREMQTQYEQRIEALEDRIAQAEARAEAEAARARAQAAKTKPMTAAMLAPSPVAPVGSSTQHRHPSHSVGTGADAGSRAGAGRFGAISSGNAFNPQISVNLDGNYYQDDIDGAGPTLVSEAFQAGRASAHAHGEEGDEHAAEDAHAGHAHGFASNGFNFSEAEISFSATVDPYFDAATYLSVDGDGNVELEEAYFQTRMLPYGLRLKGGKFLSDFGYINRQHPHQWDFVDQNLPYLNLLGLHGLQDTGLQLTWMPKLPVYTLLGAEILQGDQELFGATLGETDQQTLGLDERASGPQLYTAFVKLAPEIGPNQALQIGLSYAHNRQQQLALEDAHADDAVELHEAHEEHDAHEDELDHAAVQDHRLGFEGSASLWGLDLVYKRDGTGAHGQGDFKFQTEYLRAIRDLDLRASPEPEAIGQGRTFTTDGLYAQALYGIAPKWQLGLRYDVLGLTNEMSGSGGADYGSSERWTADLTWNLSEFSKLRAQYAYNDILVSEHERERFNAFYLQFLVSMGSHGAHDF
jgi:hypothetical protein